MSRNEEHSMSPSPFEKRPPFSSGSSEVSDDISHFQKKNNKSTTSQTPIASPMKEERKRLEKLNKKIDFIEDVRATFGLCFFVSSGASTFLLGAPGKVFGMSIYSILLSFHFLSLSCLCMVHYKLLPPLINERSILSYRVKGQGRYPPAYHLSNNEIFWCYIRILFPILTNGGIWIYLSYRDLQVDWKEYDERQKLLGVCLVLGTLLLFVSLSTILNLDHRYWKPEIKKHKTEQRKEDSNKRVNLQTDDLMCVKDELKAENMEEIRKLRNEILEKDASYTKLLQEKDAFNLKIKMETDVILKELQERDKEKDKILSELSQNFEILKRERKPK